MSFELSLSIVRSSGRRQAAQRIIQRVWQLYEEGFLNIQRFLACASHLLRAFNDSFQLTDENDVDMFVSPHANGEISLKLFYYLSPH